MFSRRFLRLVTHHRPFTTSLRVRVPQTPEGQAISEVARAEGGPSKGSASAQLQSQVAKQQNAQQEPPNSTMSQTNKTPEGQVISVVAKAEGGPSKGSTAAQMQSEITRHKNADQGVSSATSSARTPAGQAISDAAKAEGGPSRGSAAAKMQSQLAKQQNAQRSVPNPASMDTDPAARSQVDREQNFAEVASEVEDKLSMDPESVTPDDANLARSRETRAFGATAKGGIASTAQKVASENEKKGVV